MKNYLDVHQLQQLDALQLEDQQQPVVLQPRAGTAELNALLVEACFQLMLPIVMHLIQLVQTSELPVEKMKPVSTTHS